MIKGVLSLVAAGVMATSAYSADRVIYGEDNRRDVYEVEDENLLTLAKGTAMLMSTSGLTAADDDMFTIDQTRTFGAARNLCESEPYREQVNPGFCSGFLVGKDIFVTAGHCMNTSRCRSTSFVFDYNASEEGFSPAQIPAANVYTCKEVISQELGNGLDYAVVRLDREVTDREPVKFRSEGLVEVGTDLVMIGHPSGLPSKIEDGGSVRDVNRNFFVATTDSYGGNSGSAVFNLETGVVEGILVRGETDFVRQNGCTVSNVCTEDGCRGEDVSNAIQFAKHVPVVEVPETPEK